MQLGDVKAKASEAFAKGKFTKAGELYESYCAKSPKDLQSRLRMGDAWAKAGEKKRAIAAYASAAESFAKEGFLPRAIAASKLILELDPAHQGVQQMLAGLYAQKGSPAPRGSPVERREAAPAAAVASSEAASPEEAVPAATAGDDPPARIVTRAAAPPTPPDEEGEELLLDEPEPDVSVKPSVPAGPSLPSTAPAADTLEAALAAAEPSTETQQAMGALETSLRSLAAPSHAGSHEPTESPPPPQVTQARATSFTELELSGDSLLQALEEAAGHAALAHPAAAQEPPATPPTEIPGGLPRIPLFSDLPPEAFIELFERCPLRRFQQGETILEQGSVGDAFYVICEGAVRVFRTEAGHPVHLAQLKEGAFFGEMALLSGAPRTASVESASEDTQLLEISAAVLEPLARRHPTLALALRKFCRQRLLSNLMDTSELFRPFSRQDRRVLVEKFRARDVKAGELIVETGHRSDGLYVVLSGEVVVEQGVTSIARLREGELFGEMSLLTKAPALASVRAAKRTSLLRLPREDFDALILSHPQILVLVSELTESRRKQLERQAPLRAAEPDADEPLVMI